MAKYDSLGVSVSDYKFYIPEIGSIPLGTESGGCMPLISPMTQPFPLLVVDVFALLQDNAECKQRLSGTQGQLDLMLNLLDYFSLDNARPHQFLLRVHYLRLDCFPPQ